LHTARLTAGRVETVAGARRVLQPSFERGVNCF
jgi:hypothetical protein